MMDIIEALGYLEVAWDTFDKFFDIEDYQCTTPHEEDYYVWDGTYYSFEGLVVELDGITKYFIRLEVD